MVIYFVFNDAVKSSGYITSTGRIIYGEWIGKAVWVEVTVTWFEVLTHQGLYCQWRKQQQYTIREASLTDCGFLWFSLVVMEHKQAIFLVPFECLSSLHYVWNFCSCCDWCKVGCVCSCLLEFHLHPVQCHHSQRVVPVVWAIIQTVWKTSRTFQHLG
jgi:hypothetical protein